MSDEVSLSKETASPKTQCTLAQLRQLTTLQAHDDVLWSLASHIETAYVQQALRYLSHAIEGTWSYEQARDAIKEMMP